MQVNLLGSVYAIVCMVVTAQYQIYVSTKQKELGLNSTQLLTNMVPISAAITLVLVPMLDSTGLFFEQAHALVNYEFSQVRVCLRGCSASCDPSPSSMCCCVAVVGLLWCCAVVVCVIQAAVLTVVGSAVLAVFVNLSIFLLIGATSAVTYNVVGHFKTILILAFRYAASPSH